MKRKTISLFFILGILIPETLPAQPPPQKMTLKECYDFALRRSETVAITAEEINQAKARYTQALGEVLPKIAIHASELLQDDSAQGSAAGSGNVGNTLTRFSRPEVAVNVYQSLFQGFREITAIKLSGADKARARFQTEDAERLLYQDVAVAFYTVATIELDIQTDQRAIVVLKDRVRELGGRVKLGKSREGEQLAQEADVSLLEADLEEKIGLRKVAYEMLSFLTGLDPQPPIRVEDPTRQKLKAAEDYVAMVTQRPDVLASQEDVKIAKGQITISRADLLPSANAQFNYYPYRAGFLKEIHWDATFNMDVPVFNWGTFGVIREAKSKAKQSEIQAELTQRQAVTEIKKSHEAYQSSLNELKKYEIAVSKSQASYLRQTQDFQLGLITNLDVLQSERTFLDAVRQRNDAKVKTWSDWINLQIVAGIKP
jgi:outer membrane protein